MDLERCGHVVTVVAVITHVMEDQSEASDILGYGYVRVPGRIGWKPAAMVCPCIVSVLPHMAM